MDMAKLSEQSVFASIESYHNGTKIKEQIFEWSERLRELQEESSDLAIELIARYQPQEIIIRDDQTGEKTDLRCYISTLLILRYLERISDHACYIGDSILYSTTGISSPRH
jgi:phosphate uptake regulator